MPTSSYPRSDSDGDRDGSTTTDDRQMVSIRGGQSSSQPSHPDRAPTGQSPESYIDAVARRRTSVPEDVGASLELIATGTDPGDLANQGIVVVGLSTAHLTVDDLREMATQNATPEHYERVASNCNLWLAVRSGLENDSVEDTECDYRTNNTTFYHEPDTTTGDHEYCSARCYARARADNIIDLFTGDHRFCANCFRWLQVVTPPRAEHKWGGTTNGRYLSDQDVTKEAHTGRGVARHTTQDGVGSVSYNETEEYIPGTGDGIRPITLHKTTTACECGVTSHSTREWPLTKDNAIAAAKRLADNLGRLREQWLLGSEQRVRTARRWQFSRDLFLYAVGELKTQSDTRYSDQRIFRTALAAALYAPQYRT